MTKSRTIQERPTLPEIWQDQVLQRVHYYNMIFSDCLSMLSALYVLVDMMAGQLRLDHRRWRGRRVSACDGVHQRASACTSVRIRAPWRVTTSPACSSWDLQ